MKILLAIDVSEASQAAVDEVALRPWPVGASVEVLTVVEPTHLWEMSESAEAVSRRSEEVVQAAVRKLQSRGLNAGGHTLPGDPKTVILDRAQESGADFLFAGTHGVSGLTRFLMGNIAAAIVRYAPCSVALVRARPNGGSGASKVLLATDGSEYSELAAHSIAARPWPPGTQFQVFSAVELVLPPVQAMFQPPLPPSAEGETRREEAMKAAQHAVASAVRILAPVCPQVSESISVLMAPPRRVILEEASGWGADLIVVGSHGRRGAQRFLMGSVSEAVAMHAHCSVEVIRKRAS